MEIRQPARLVALDTEVFVRNNFNYKSTLFVKLIELSESEKIYLYLTTVVQREVLAHIHQEVQEAKKNFEKLHKEFRKQAK
ncbi:MAG TPA: PIN domain-containing protein, partial [Kamptonema sp.]|nr:PIN domain-containing protein [Kamptonema sp.]